MATEIETDMRGWWSRLVGRRTLLRGGVLGGAGLAAAALIGCGGDDDDDDTASTTTTTTTTTTTAQATATAAPSVNVADTTADDDEEEGGATATTETETLGELVQDPALPYPYNFPEPNKTPQSGGIMRVAATWNFQSLDPIDSAAGGTVTVPNMVYNRLIGFKRGPGADVFQPEIEPELAASWERSPDGLTFTFQIQDNVTWQNVAPLNGRQFTAEDARYALNRYATEGVHKSYYANVSDFEAVDGLTLKVNMAAATADFLNPLASNKQTIFPKELVDDDSIKTTSVGTGPMILTDLEIGQ
ncbi:MAG: ABC transporter substrate-binding protein, partial [Chloroflexi bacterium]|nr:ABC transporter substrate-binding protein [Chloroflexota bacterium]